MKTLLVRIVCVILSFAIAGQGIAAPICNVGANPWHKGRTLVEGEKRYMVRTQHGASPFLVQSLDGDGKLSNACTPKDGTIIVIRDGFDTSIEHPELELLPTDSVFVRDRKLRQYPWIEECGNPMPRPFEFIIRENSGEGGISRAVLSATGNESSAHYRPIDSFLSEDDTKEEDSWSCDGWCVFWIGVAAIALGVQLGKKDNKESPPPVVPPAGDTGGAGNGTI